MLLFFCKTATNAPQSPGMNHHWWRRDGVLSLRTFDKKGSALGAASLRFTMTLALCLLLAACSQSLTNWNRSASSGPKTPGKDGLIKPRIAEKKAPDKDGLIEPLVPEFTFDDKDNKAKGSPASLQKTENGNSAEKVVPETPQKIAKSSGEADKPQPKEKTIPDTSPKPSAAGTPAPKNETDKSSSRDEPAKEGPKKFDHVKYLEQIRSKAIDLVNKERNCSHAVLCKDSITEGWTLSIYRVQDRHFTSAVFMWDDIDEKWEEALVPDKRPVAQLKEHLKISAEGKECKPLKGAMP